MSLFTPLTSLRAAALTLVGLVLLASARVVAAPTHDVYLLGPDSQPHDDVPKGKVIGPLTLASQVFTTREIKPSIYPFPTTSPNDAS